MTVKNSVTLQCCIQGIETGEIVQVVQYQSTMNDVDQMTEEQLDEEAEKFSHHFINTYLPEELEKSELGKEILKNKDRYLLAITEPVFTPITLQ